MGGMTRMLSESNKNVGGLIVNCDVNGEVLVCDNGCAKRTTESSF